MTEKKLKRVAITGMGIVCGNGQDLNSVWENITAGKSGISKIEEYDHSNLKVDIAGEVKNFKISEELLGEKEAPRYDRFIHFALHAADQAVKDANGVLEAYDKSKIGCLMGVGIGGFPIIENTAKALIEKGPRRVSPFFIPAIIPNMATGLISIKLGVEGINYSISSACASAAHAISAAAYEIQMGRQDAVITGGAESVTCTIGLQGFISMKALGNNEDPTKASCPFSTKRNGFIMGEGAGVLILEDLDRAKARGAKIYAEVVGNGASSDAYHITAPRPDGEGAMKSMMMAIEQAGIKPSDIGYVNAHGTSTPVGDIAETNAIKKTFGDHANNLLISSTKSMTGHLLGAAGGIETIFCAMALDSGTLPPTINLDEQDPECDLNYIPNEAKKAQVDYALNNSFGFGGTNSSLVLKRYTGE